MLDERAWFAPKRVGYGAGLPIAWQGWALVGGYLVLAVVIGRAMHAHPAARVVLLLAVTAGFGVIAARTTRGGWRWRRGE